MKKIFKFLFLIIFPLQLLFGGTVIINKKFDTDLFNSTLKNVPEIYTFNDIEKLINDQYGYNIYNNIPELEGNKRYFIDNDKLVGDFISKIADSFDAIATVNDEKSTISFKPLYSTFIKFPSGWNIQDTLNDLQVTNPHINFKINSNRIYAYGSETNINKITPILNNIEYYANKSTSFLIKVLPYKTNDTKSEFIGYRKGSNFGGDATFKGEKNKIETVINLKHKDIYGFQYKDKFITMKLNLVKNVIIFNNYFELPLNEISNLGYVFTIYKNNNIFYDNSFFNNKNKKEKYIVILSKKRI